MQSAMTEMEQVELEHLLARFQNSVLGMAYARNNSWFWLRNRRAEAAALNEYREALNALTTFVVYLKVTGK